MLMEKGGDVDLRDIVAVLLRQWAVCLIGAITLVLGAVAVVLLVPTTYQANAQLLFLLPPQAGGPDLVTNPLLNLDSNMTNTASLIAATQTTQEAHKQVEAAGFTSEYSLALPPGAGPVLTLSAVDTDQDMALKTREEVVQRCRDELASLQTDLGAPASQTMTIRTIAAPRSAEAVPGSKIRALAVLAGVGGVVTILVAMLRDRRRRRDRNESQALPGEDAAGFEAEVGPPRHGDDSPDPGPSQYRDAQPDPVGVGDSSQGSRPAAAAHRTRARVRQSSRL